jgi:hypothetical protein
MSKDYICDFIDFGYKEFDDWDEGFWNVPMPQDLHFHTNMSGAKVLLPILERGPLHITDGRWCNPIRQEVPIEVKQLVCQQSDGHYSWNSDKYNFITNYNNVSKEGETEKWVLEKNDLGRKLLQWFRKE